MVDLQSTLHYYVEEFCRQDPRTGKFVLGNPKDQEQQGKTSWAAGLKMEVKTIMASGLPMMHGKSEVRVGQMISKYSAQVNTQLRLAELGEGKGASAAQVAKRIATAATWDKT